MRILEICLSPDYGGLEQYFRDFVRWLREQSVDVAALVSSGSQLFIDLEAANLEQLHRTPSPHNLIAKLKTAVRLSRWLDELEIDVMHAHWKYDLPLAAWAGMFARRETRLVHSRHMDMPGRKRDPYHRLVYSRVDLMHTVTQHLAGQVRRNLNVPHDRLVVVHPGAAACEVTDDPDAQRIRTELGLDERFTVAVIGRISPYKGQHLLLEALAQLKEEGRDLQGLIVGRPDRPEHLESLLQQVRELELESDVRIHSFRSDIPAVLHQLDVLALTTVKETFGMILVEAMRAGVPVIGSDAGGVPEIIEHDISGLLFESGNPRALADAIRRYYDDEVLRTRLALAGQERARDHFDRNRQFAALWQRIDSVATGG